VTGAVQGESKKPFSHRPHQIHREHVAEIFTGHGMIEHAHQHYRTRTDEKHNHRMRLAGRDLDLRIVVEPPSRIREMKIMQPELWARETVIAASPDAEQPQSTARGWRPLSAKPNLPQQTMLPFTFDELQRKPIVRSRQAPLRIENHAEGQRFHAR